MGLEYMSHCAKCGAEMPETRIGTYCRSCDAAWAEAVVRLDQERSGAAPMTATPARPYRDVSANKTTCDQEDPDDRGTIRVERDPTPARPDGAGAEDGYDDAAFTAWLRYRKEELANNLAAGLIDDTNPEPARRAFEAGYAAGAAVERARARTLLDSLQHGRGCLVDRGMFANPCTCGLDEARAALAGEGGA